MILNIPPRKAYWEKDIYSWKNQSRFQNQKEIPFALLIIWNYLSLGHRSLVWIIKNGLLMWMWSLLGLGHPPGAWSQPLPPPFPPHRAQSRNGGINPHQGWGKDFLLTPRKIRASPRVTGMNWGLLWALQPEQRLTGARVSRKRESRIVHAGCIFQVTTTSELSNLTRHMFSKQDNWDKSWRMGNSALGTAASCLHCFVPGAWSH